MSASIVSINGLLFEDSLSFICPVFYLFKKVCKLCSCMYVRTVHVSTCNTCSTETKMIVIKNGSVFDSYNKIYGEKLDILMKDGVIRNVGPAIETTPNTEVFDASNLMVLPGLIDLHIHGYQYATPLGMDVDRYCLGRGVTTAVDAGSSGAGTFLGLKKFVIDKSRARVNAFLHIANHGLASSGCAGFGCGGESDCLNQLNVQQCVNCIQNNTDEIVGVKLRLAKAVSNDGANELESLKLALEASTKAEVPLMVHHAHSTISTEFCVNNLRSGDIYTHCFHGGETTIANGKEGILSEVWNARNKGVLFDVGHGRGSFSWKTAEIAAKNGFWPDTISTDLHNENWDGPAYDLVTVMSKLLHLGMPLNQLLAAVTSTPAKILKHEQNLGSLSEGTVADITALKTQNSFLEIEDCEGNTRLMNSSLEAVAAWKGGRPVEIEPRFEMIPNIERIIELKQEFAMLRAH